MLRNNWTRNKLTKSPLLEKELEIQNLIATGYLKVSELDPAKTYVFTLGNENFMPAQEDLENFRNLIEDIRKDSGPNFPCIITSAFARIEENPNAQETSIGYSGLTIYPQPHGISFDEE